MFGSPEESVNARKQHKLKMMACQYLQQKKLWALPYSIDGVFIEARGGGCDIRHLENIIQT
jgi:Holliday junction resolvase-like predicted endonuclease